jgi:hypothetical protein
MPAFLPWPRRSEALDAGEDVDQPSQGACLPFCLGLDELTWPWPRRSEALDAGEDVDQPPSQGACLPFCLGLDELTWPWPRRSEALDAGEDVDRPPRCALTCFFCLLPLPQRAEAWTRARTVIDLRSPSARLPASSAFCLGPGEQRPWTWPLTTIDRRHDSHSGAIRSAPPIWLRGGERSGAERRRAVPIAERSP